MVSQRLFANAADALESGRSAVCDGNLGSLIIVYFGVICVCAAFLKVLKFPSFLLSAVYCVSAECVSKAPCGSTAAG